MTLLAGHDNMQTYQRKAAEIVIEMNVVAPPGFNVALLAARTQLPHVHIILTMTIAAIHAQLLRGKIGGMTLVALQFGVWAGQCKPGIACVIE